MFTTMTSAIAALLIIFPASGLNPHTSIIETVSPSSSGHTKTYFRGASAASSRLIQRQETWQPDSTASTVTTTNENFFERMGNAFIGLIVGIIMMIFSVPILWLNEKRNAKYEALIDKGESECRSINADDFDAKNTHWLVHATGKTVSTRPVKDAQFNVAFDSGVIRITSAVEIYQWKEEEKSETRERENMVGGGKTTETRKWKEYSTNWMDTYNSGENFEKQGHRNSKPDHIDPGHFSKTCERVEFGRGFILGSTELDQLSGGTYPKLNKLVCEKNPKLSFTSAEEGWHYCGKSTMSSPQVGDIRVKFTVLHDGAATVVALQDKSKEDNRGSFAPYRVIRRPLCPCFGLSEDQEKERLYQEAKKSTDEINAEEMWGGFMGCLCCACNCVQMCYTKLMMPEIQHTWNESLSPSEAFKRMRSTAAMMKWGCRVLGWLMMFFGLVLVFSPFTTFLKILPFGIGSFLSSLAGGIVFIFSLMVTLVIATLIVALAYNLYHPLLGMISLFGVAALVAGIIVICNLAAGKSAMG